MGGEATHMLSQRSAGRKEGDGNSGNMGDKFPSPPNLATLSAPKDKNEFFASEDL